MVIPNPNSKPLEVHDEHGRVIAYIVAVEEMERLRGEMEELRKHVATLQRQKDHYIAELLEVYRTNFPPPPTEEEMLSAVDNSHELQQLIDELKAR
jgi:hypothetical protein